MKVIDRNISELIGAEYNPRFINDEAFEDLKDSIKRFDAVEPVLINMNPKRLNIIISGHQRIKAAKALEMKTFPCVELNLSIAKEKELNIRMNKNTGAWDWDALANNFDVEELTEWGFTEDELFGNIEEELEAEEDDYDIPEEINTDIVSGDLIEIGNHRLMCGDSTDSDQVSKLMDGEKADLFLIDPPYNISFKAQRSGKGYSEHNDSLDDSEYTNLLKSVYSNALLFSDKSIITSGKQNMKLWFQNFDITDVAIWIAKNKMSGGKISNLSLWEPILFIGKFDRNSRPTDVYEYNTKIQHDANEHPCPKVIDFFAELIKCYCDKDVLDLFIGSGTTMVASHQLKRKCYGMELDPKYCQVIIDRMLKLDDTLEVKINGKDYTQ